MKEKIIFFEPKLKEKIYVIPSGYRTTLSNQMLCNEIRVQIDALSRPRLVYISLPRKHKNHITLIRAFAKIRNTFPGASLILTAGKDNPHDKDIQKIRNYLNNEIEKLGLSDKVIWFEWLTPDEVNYVLSASDLMVFPSLVESFGLPLVEAMSMGCPILASDLSYAHDVAGEAAIYFNPYNSDALADSMISVLSSPQILKALSKAGKERSKLYSYKNIAEQITEIFEKIIKQ